MDDRLPYTGTKERFDRYVMKSQQIKLGLHFLLESNLNNSGQSAL